MHVKEFLTCNGWFLRSSALQRDYRNMQEKSANAAIDERGLALSFVAATRMSSRGPPLLKT